MSPTRVDAFVDAARDVDAAVTRTDAATFTETLADAVTAPAVGTPLPFDGLSYEGTAVDALVVLLVLAVVAAGADALGSVGRRAADTRVGHLLAAVLAPPEPPDADAERADAGRENGEPDADR
jgi:hypothetical protein